MPTDPWITARDPPPPLRQNTCMEFLASALEAHAAAGAGPEAVNTAEFLQRGFEKLEAEGKVYRIDPAATPTKFMDATLNREEVEVLRGCAASILRDGRVASLTPMQLAFSDGSIHTLPGPTPATHVTCTVWTFGETALQADKLPETRQNSLRPTTGTF